MIDLHTHSTFSDGSLSPRELAELGGRTGLSAVALTDHDCTDGLSEFMAECAKSPVEGVPGVEISAEVSSGTLHMLGYFIDTENQRLQEVLRDIRGGREIRNEKILKKLNDLGLELSWEEVKAYAGEDVVGRPHFSRAMVDKGYVKSKTQAFEKYLAKGKPAYADRLRMSPEESLSVIREAGGVPVMAHPFTLDMSDVELDEYVGKLVDIGLEGIEVFYSEHSVQQTGRYRELTRKYGLVMTGGSDFHGDANPGVKLGKGFGGLSVADELLEPLKERAARMAPVCKHG